MNNAATHDLERRVPVWEAISELFVDSATDERDIAYIAARLRDSGYDDATLHAIHASEVAPVCAWNLLGIAGIWQGFQREWLTRAILAISPALVGHAPPRDGWPG